MLTPEQIEAAENEAEAIVLAGEVGMFRGTAGEYATALLILQDREKRLKAAETEQATQIHELRERAEQDTIEEARAKGDY